ncbi:hypothetical protein C8J56DRAFT_1121398 [Mycena floridula]|nr:hypothetical protein C8J56DRAFT_1121398 [Mycena floridula]
MFQVASHPTSFSQPTSRGRQHAAPAQTPSAAPLQLPRTLARPQVAEVTSAAISAAAPELANVPPEYIRRNLRHQTPAMLAGLSALTPYVPNAVNRIPSHFPTPLRSPTTPSGPVYPTHVLAVSSSKTTSRDILTFPVHSLVLASQCALLPPLSPPRSSSTVDLPVVPLSLPSAAAFFILHTFMYNQRLDGVLKGLFPMPAGFVDSVSHEIVKNTLSSGPALHRLSVHLCTSSSSNLQTLMTHAAHVKELWQDTVCLGLYSPSLWDTLDLAWEVVLGALNLAATS